MPARLLPPVPADAPVPSAKSRSMVRPLLIGLLAGVVLGAGVGAVMIALDSRVLANLFAGYDAAGWAWPLLLLLAALGSIFMHEMGHVIGGLSVGFRFGLLIVGPLRVEREPSGKLTFGLNKDIATGGGIAALYPEDQRDLVRRFAWMIATGPIGSVVTAVLCLAVMAALSPRTATWSFFATLAGMSLGIALATLAPMRAGYFLTDGARLLQLRRGGPAAERDAAMLSLLATQSTAASMDSWDRATVLASIEPCDGSIFELQGRTFAYGWALSKGAIDDARDQMQRAMAISAGLPPVLRGALENELAFMDAMYPPAGTAPAVAEPPKAPGVPEYARLRTLAAVAVSRGDFPAAQASLDAARRLHADGKSTAKGGDSWELDRLREIEARMTHEHVTR